LKYGSTTRTTPSRFLKTSKRSMKICSYCGRENPDNAANCSGCGLDEWENQPASTVQPPDNESNNDWVTLADDVAPADLEFVISSFDSAGIQIAIPEDQSGHAPDSETDQAGHIQIQVRRRDYDAAQRLLSSITNSSADTLSPAPDRGGKKVIASMEAGQTGEILARLKQTGVPVEVHTATEESGLDMSEILVEDAFYDRGCDVVEAFFEEEKEKRSKIRCSGCRSKNIERVPHDRLGYIYRCKDCGSEFIS
jgi:hypothetical protein